MNYRVLADTHVHLHELFPLEVFFGSARRHFQRQQPRAPGHPSIEILCLADLAGQDSVARLCDQLKAAGPWHFSREAAGAAVKATHRDGHLMYLLPGRQLASEENLEVLALDVVMTPPAKPVPIKELTEQVQAAGGIAVAPWGFGKWTGRRARAMEALMDQSHNYFLAHNGNRWYWAGEHGLFARATERNIPVLAGSDPLPFRSDAGRAGSSGIAGDISGPWNSASECFRRLISQRGSWVCYGKGTPTLAFLTKQIGMQIRKHLPVR